MKVFVELNINNTIHYVSLEGVATDTQWYAPYVINLDSVQYRIKHLYGGYIAPQWGSITLTQDVFANDWPPPQTIGITIKVGDTQDIQFEGSGYLDSFTRESVTYTLQPLDLSQDCLDQAPDFPETSPVTYNDNRVYPIAFGSIVHANPLRIGLDTEYKYHKGDIAGVIGTDWHVYDDGVNIDANVTDNSDGTFNLSAAPVGEVTISGNGTNVTLIDVFSWGAAKLGLTLNSTYARSPSPKVNVWLNQQQKVIDFLDLTASFYTHCFYIRAGVLHLIDMAATVGTKTITEFEYMPSQYHLDQAVKSISCSWNVAQAVSDNTGNHIKRTQETLDVMTGLSYGEQIDVTPYGASKSDNNTAINSIISYLNKYRTRLKMPYTSLAPSFGETVNWVDNSHINVLNGSIKVRNIEINFADEEVILEGEGNLS